jgi:hypothetical protein
MNAIFPLLLVASIIFALPRNAHAYLDPGTGSYVFQILTAVFIGAIFSIKVFFKNIKAFFYGIFKIKPSETDEE